MLFLIALYLLSVNTFSINCYGTNLCANHTKSLVTEHGNRLWSYYEPESLCHSCQGNNDCNNTNPVCSKSLVHLDFSVVDLLGGTLSRITTLLNVTNKPLLKPIIGCFFQTGTICNQRKREIDTIDTVVSYTDKTIFVTSANAANTLVFWTLNEFSGSFQCNPTDCQMKLPDSYLVKDGVLRVQVFIGDVKDSDRTFPIVAAHTCQIRECSFICLDYVTNFVCYSVSTQIIIGCSFVMSTLLFMALIFFLVYKLYCCMANKYYVHLKSDSGIPLQTLGVSLICCCLLFSPVSGQCLTTTIIQSNINSCSSFQGNGTCEVVLNSLINLPNLGHKVCILITSPTGENLARLNITYELSLIRVDTTPLYFTSNWQGLACSHRSCRNDDICGLNSGCATDLNALNSVISGECLSWPGKTTCGTSCGCAGCGCFFCSDACLVSRYAFKPFGSVAQVFSIDGARSVPRVVVDYLPTGKPLQTFSLDLNQAISQSNFTFTLIGSYASLTPYFSDLGFINFNGFSYLAPISAYNNPQFGSVGDIQTTVPAFFPGVPFIFPSTSISGIPAQYTVDYLFPVPAFFPGVPFIFPSTSISGIPAQYTVDYLFPVSGAELLNNNNILPKVVNGISWTSAGTYPVGLNPNPGAVSISLQSLPLTYKFLTTTICPKITSFTTSGCFNCPQGASFNIIAKSVCDQGSAMVSIESSDPIVIATKFIVLTGSPTSHIIYFSSVKQHISGSICLSYQNNKDCAAFTTVLNIPPPLTPQEIQDVFGNFTFPVVFSDFSSWWDSLTGTSSIVKAIFILGIIVAIVTAIGIVGFVVYKTWQANKDEARHNFNKFYYSNDEEYGEEYLTKTLDEPVVQPPSYWTQ